MIATIASIALSLAAPQADANTDTRIARRVGVAFSDCVFARHEADVRAAVAMPVDQAAHKSLAEVMTGFCLTQALQEHGLRRGQLQVSQTIFRGLAFEHMYRHDFDVADRQQRLETVEALYPKVSGHDGNSDPRFLYRVSMLLGDCVVKRDPGAARALLRTTVASRSEREAFVDVRANFASCAATIPVGDAAARAMVAESLYWLTSAAKRPLRDAA